MSVATRLPELNTDLILDLIWWAEKSENEDEPDGPEGYKGWGRWYQNAWASVTNRTEHPIPVSNETLQDPNLCGTAYCMAGQTVVQSGYRLDIGGLETLTPFWEGRVDWCVPQRDSGRRTEKGRIIYEDVPGAEPVLISDAATEILGLTGYEKDVFFAGENTIPTLKRWANLFADVRDLPVLFPEESLADRDLIYYE